MIVASLVSAAVAFFAVHLDNSKCKLLMQPSACTSYSIAKSVAPLPKQFGQLVYYESSRPGAYGTCLLVHGLYQNANAYLFLVHSLLQTFSHVIVLEPRGFGSFHGSPSLASTIVSVKIALDQLQQEGLGQTHLVAFGLGANIARFASYAFRLPFVTQTYLRPVSTQKMFQQMPWTKSCRTGALFDWNSWFDKFPHITRVTRTLANE